MSALRRSLVAGATSLILIVFVGCQTTPMVYAPLTSAKPYKETFAVVDAYVRKCLPGARVRSNLYTDVPEGDLVVDEIPAVGFAPGSYAAARQVLNIHFVGEAQKTRVEVKNEMSEKLVASALRGEPCTK